MLFLDIIMHRWMGVYMQGTLVVTTQQAVRNENT